MLRILEGKKSEYLNISSYVLSFSTEQRRSLCDCSPQVFVVHTYHVLQVSADVACGASVIGLQSVLRSELIMTVSLLTVLRISFLLPSLKYILS